MTEQHTAEPIELVIHSRTAPKAGWPCGIYAKDKFDEDDDKTLLIADFDDVSDVPLPTCLANARRFVACWNACKGIPTEQLEVLNKFNDCLRLTALCATAVRLADDLHDAAEVAQTGQVGP